MVTSIQPPTFRAIKARSENRQWHFTDLPLGFNAGDTNLNRYVGNSPPNATDPTGLVIRITGKQDFVKYLGDLGLQDKAFGFGAPGKDSAAFNLVGATGNTLDLRDRFNLGANDLEKEIVLGMLERGRTFEFGSFTEFRDSIKIRMAIVENATKDVFDFGTVEDAKRNPKFWIERSNPDKPSRKFFCVKDDVAPSAAIRDAFKPSDDKSYALSCRRALELLMVKGYLDVYSKDQGAIARFDKLFGHGEPAKDFYDRFLVYEDPVAHGNIAPGDWVRFINPDFSVRANGENSGMEGSNTIYLGGDRFADYYGGQPRTFDDNLFRVYEWNHKGANRTSDLIQRLREQLDDRFETSRKTMKTAGQLVPR